MGIFGTSKGRVLTKLKSTKHQTAANPNEFSKGTTSIFSLPPELLQEIFAHLVKPDHIKYDPRDPNEPDHMSKAYSRHGGTAHSYRFHTEILRVNKATGAAAAEYMHSHSTFVLMTYRCAGLTAMLHRMDVPIVADRKVKSARHSFGIKLSWSINPFNTIADRKRAKLKASKKGSALILTRDLGKLLNLLHFHCSFLAPKRVSMIGGHDPMVTKGTLSKYTPTMKLRSTGDPVRPKALGEGDWEDFVCSFSQIVGLGYKLKLEVCGSSSQLVRHKATTPSKSSPTWPDEMAKPIAPGIVWPRAIWWDRFEVANAFKQQADDFARQGDLEAARARYEFLVCWAECDCFSTIKKLDITRDSALLAAQERWLLLLFDCCVSQSWLHLRLQKIDTQYPRCGYRLTSILVKLEETWGGSRSSALDSVWSHVVLLAVVCILTKGRKSAARVPMIASELILLRKTWGQEIKEHEAHDHALVEDAVSQLQAGGKFEVPLEQLSAKVLPIRIFDHQSEAKMPGRPEGLVNWQDKEHLARLTSGEQAAISAAQKKISAFDLTL